MKRFRFLTTAVSPPPIRRIRSAESSRRGIALLIVLLLVSMTLGLSYAAVRSQYTALQIHRNADRRASARQAAVTGLTMAIKKMHTSDWAGVDTTLTGSPGDYQRFEVTYTLGDPAFRLPDVIDWDNPDYDDPYYDFPYRVTLLSTGYADDPDDPNNPARTTRHQIRAVVRLAPRDLTDEPSDWTAMQKCTVYQSKRDLFELDIPCRIEGPVRAQGRLKIAMHYPNDTGGWSRYLGDLNAMRLAGLPDYRPLNGPVDLCFTEQDGKHLSVLRNELAVTANDTPNDEAASDWVKPTSLFSYQIHPKGPVYVIPSVATTLENVTLAPDPLTNPLGIYYCGGSITIRNGVTIRGSLFCKDDIRIEGTDVRFQSVELPALYGSDAPLRLPVATCQHFIVKPTAEGSVTGLVAVFDRFEIQKSPDTVRFAIEGRLITRKLLIKERQPWETLSWPDLYGSFQDQLDDDDAVPYFPVWLGTRRGLDPKPLLTVKPDPAATRYHWHKPQDPVYVAHPDDDGLRWDLLEWTEDP